MTLWWLVPVVAMAGAALLAAVAGRRLRDEAAGLGDDAAALAAAGADAAALGRAVAAVRDRLDDLPGTDPGSGDR